MPSEHPNPQPPGRADPPPPPPPPPPPSGLPASAPDAIEWDPPQTTPRRLPTASLFTGLDPRSLVFGVVALISAGPILAVILPVLAIIVLVNYLQWRAFQYGFDGTVVRVQQGVLQRRHRSIAIDRIQQVEVEQPLRHRILGLSVLRLETASDGGETEVELDGLRRADAEQLQAHLRPRTGRPEPGDDVATTIVSLSTGRLALGAVTGAQLFTLPAALLVLAETLLDVGGGQDLTQRLTGLAEGVGLAALIVLGGAIALSAAVIAAVLRDADYRLERRGDDILIRRGLLTTRQAVLPVHRVQVVEVHQNWLRRAMGVASVDVRSAGGGAASDDDRRIQVPLIEVGQPLDDLLTALLPEVPPAESFQRHPPAARRRSIVRTTTTLLVAAVVLGVLAVALHSIPTLAIVPWSLPAIVAAALVILGPVLGEAEYRHLGHALGAQVVSSRHGALRLTVAHAPLVRLQGITQSDHILQRRLGLGSVTGHLAGAGETTTILIRDVAAASAQQLRERLTVAAAGRVDAPPRG